MDTDQGGSVKIKIEKQLLKSLTVLASMIEARDAYTGGHLWRVSRFCRQLAEAVGLPRDMVFLAALGGFLHDIGKISIPDEILGKRGRLTENEYAVVKTHPEIGALLIQEHPLGDLALAAVHQHHEWVNGAGYPQRLEGEQVSIYARIASIADAFDALTSTRPYRQEVSVEPALMSLKKERGTQFDSHLLDVFIGWVETDAASGIVGHSDSGVAMVRCPSCGPVITVSRDTQDGDIVHCRVCGSAHRLNRHADTFVVEPLGRRGSADDLKPRPETRPIETFVSSAPASVTI
jgi:HD-GYP domain-containing protein (c-di-GMP phosphodiesterase class II)